jgi:hypothetical protein
MNPRLAVSILFVLVAVSAIRPEARDAFRKLQTLHHSHSWADNVHNRCGAEILNRITSRVSALKSELHGHKEMDKPTGTRGDCAVHARDRARENQPCRVGSISSDGKTNTSSFSDDASVPRSQERNMQGLVMNLIDSGRRTAAFERVTAAVRQIREVLDLVRTK